VILQRMVQMSICTLVHHPSGLRRRDRVGMYLCVYYYVLLYLLYYVLYYVLFFHLFIFPFSSWTICIGDGLFSSLRYLPSNTIAIFDGEEISAAECVIRTTAGNGGYIIRLSVDKVLDCYAAYRRGTCMASYANCPKLCRDTATNKLAKKNCRLAVRVLANGKRRAQLLAVCTIKPEKEIL
jgi:hypothetical protein